MYEDASFKALAVAVIIEAVRDDDKAFFRSPLFGFWCDVAEINATALWNKWRRENDVRRENVKED